MLIINFEKIEDFRYSIAKMLFVKYYKNEYGEFEDIPETNLLKVKKENKYISILQAPNQDVKDKGQVIVYYLSDQSKKKNKKQNRKYRNIVLSAIYKKDLNKYIEDAFFSSDDFISNIINNIDLEIKYIRKYIFYFNKLLNYNLNRNMIDLNNYIEKSFPDHLTLYKYYSKETIENDTYGRLQGKLSYVHPDTFNDPFDCYQENNSNENIMDYFRVLCLTPNHKNILMWSHYGSEHKGYCLQYKLTEIINNTITKHSNKNITLLIGKIKYSTSRTEKLIGTFSYTNIKNNINVTYKKFIDWSYEDEFRLVMVSKSFKKMEKYINIETALYNKYCGINNLNAIGYTKLKMDKKEYLLND